MGERRILLNSIELKTSLKAYEIRTQGERDNKFNEAVAKLNQVFSSVQAIDAEKNPEGFQDKLKVYESDAEKLLKSKGVTAALVQTQQKTVEENIANLKNELKQALESNQERKKLLGLIKENFMPLSSYKLVLSKFVASFPTDPETENIQKILKMIPAYLNGEMLRNLNPETVTMGDVEKYSKRLKERPGSNIWRHDLKKYLAYKKMYLENVEAVKKELSMLKKLRMMKFKVLRFNDKEGDLLEFHTEGKIEKKFSQINKKRYCRLKTQVVIEDGKEGETYTFMQDGSGGWKIRRGKSTIYTDLKAFVPLEKEVPFAGHVSFCTAINLDIALKKPQEYQLFLIKSINKLKTSDDINPYIRLQLIQKLFSLAKKFTISNKRIYARHEEDIKKFLEAAGEVNWLNLTIAVRKKMIERIKEIPDLERKAEKECLEAKLLTATVGRRIREIGVLQDKKLVQKQKVESNEIWALRENDGALEFLVIGSLVDGEAKWDPKFANKLIEREPLFAPMDGRSTKDMAEQLKEGVKGRIEWPYSWPMNVR